MPEDLVSQILKSEAPIFEIFAGLSEDGSPPQKCYRIYYNGRVEGFDERIGVINGYPALLVTLAARVLQKDKLHHQQNATIQPQPVLGTESLPYCRIRSTDRRAAISVK